VLEVSPTPIIACAENGVHIDKSSKFIFLFLPSSLCMYACMFVCMYVCMHVCVCVCVCATQVFVMPMCVYIKPLIFCPSLTHSLSLSIAGAFYYPRGASADPPSSKFTQFLNSGCLAGRVGQVQCRAGQCRAVHDVV
jgi:hypothetical protein